MSGIRLTRDDQIRRTVIMSLLCRNVLDTGVVESQYGIDFKSYFARELNILADYVTQGLLEQQNGVFNVTDRGRLVVRKICMAFDVYLPEHLKSGRRFSRVL